MTIFINCWGKEQGWHRRPCSFPLTPQPCHSEWEEIFNFHYAGMTEKVNWLTPALSKISFVGFKEGDVFIIYANHFWNVTPFSSFREEGEGGSQLNLSLVTALYGTKGRKAVKDLHPCHGNQVTRPRFPSAAGLLCNLKIYICFLRDSYSLTHPVTLRAPPLSSRREGPGVSK